MLIGLFALAGGLQALVPAQAAAMIDAGSQCQTLGDMYLNEITGQYEFCRFDGSGGSGGGGGPLYVGTGGGSGAAPGSPVPGTGRPGEVIVVSGKLPPKCGYPGVICVNIGVYDGSSPDGDRKRGDHQPRGGGRRGAEVPKKKASPKKKPAAQDEEPAGEEKLTEEEKERRRRCRDAWYTVRYFQRRYEEIRDEGTLTTPPYVRGGITIVPEQVDRLEGEAREAELRRFGQMIKEWMTEVTRGGCG